MKSIVFLLRYWPYFGGGETVTRLLAREFLNRGYLVHVLYWWDRYEDRLYEDEDNVKKHRINVPGPIGDSMTSPAHYHELFSELKKYVATKHIDVIINQWWPAQVFEEKLPAKIISCYHANLLRPDTTKNPLKRLYHIAFPEKFNGKRLVHLDELYEISDLLVFLAESYKKEYDKYSIAYNPKKETAFVHNPSTYTGFLDDNWKENKKKELLFVGRIYENHKNLTLLLEVWNEVLKSGVNDWTLKIIGDGPDLPMTKEKAARLGLKNLKFLGTKDPKEDYKTASIFVMTSRFEGWPMTIVEAQHYGVVPVVVNSFSALNEMLEGNSGVIVNSMNPHDIAKRILHLINDSQERMKLAGNAICKAETYNVVKIVDTWETIL